MCSFGTTVIHRAQSKNFRFVDTRAPIIAICRSDDDTKRSNYCPPPAHAPSVSLESVYRRVVAIRGRDTLVLSHHALNHLSSSGLVGHQIRRAWAREPPLFRRTFCLFRVSVRLRYPRLTLVCRRFWYQLLTIRRGGIAIIRYLAATPPQGAVKL